jgi:hypothetical protein
MLQVVKKEYAGKLGVTRFLLRLVGSQADGPYIYTYSDGYRFQPYPKGTDPKGWESLKQRGCTDITGAKFQPYVDAAGLGYRKNNTKLPPGYYVNWLELDK